MATNDTMIKCTRCKVTQPKTNFVLVEKTQEYRKRCKKCNDRSRLERLDKKNVKHIVSLYNEYESLKRKYMRKGLPQDMNDTVKEIVAYYMELIMFQRSHHDVEWDHPMLCMISGKKPDDNTQFSGAVAIEPGSYDFASKVLSEIDENTMILPLIAKELSQLLKEDVYVFKMKRAGVFMILINYTQCNCHTGRNKSCKRHDSSEKNFSYNSWRFVQALKQMDIIKEELIAKACHPDRIMQWTDDLEFHQELRSQ
jgi:hypothetical protein